MPPANVDVETRVFQQGNIQLVNVDDILTHEIDLNNASITAGYGFYEGTKIGIKRAFGLTHKGLPIFLREFDGGDSAIVNTTDNTIRIPDHFFTSGEEVNYSVGDIHTCSYWYCRNIFFWNWKYHYSTYKYSHLYY